MLLVVDKLQQWIYLAISFMVLLSVNVMKDTQTQHCLLWWCYLLCEEGYTKHSIVEETGSASDRGNPIQILHSC